MDVREYLGRSLSVLGSGATVEAAADEEGPVGTVSSK
jgi:hypothetical protein